MDGGGLQDKGLVALIVLLVGAVGSLIRRAEMRRVRRRAEDAARQASAAEHAAVEERRKAAQAKADAALAADKAKIEGMTEDELLSDAKARIDRGDAEPRKGLFTPPPRR